MLNVDFHSSTNNPLEKNKTSPMQKNWETGGATRRAGVGVLLASSEENLVVGEK